MIFTIITLALVLCSGVFTFNENLVIEEHPEQHGTRHFMVALGLKNGNHVNNIIYTDNDSDGTIDRKMIAKAFFTEASNKTGWSYLSIKTNHEMSDKIQAYAAGYIEGQLTRDFIDAHLQNTKFLSCDNFAHQGNNNSDNTNCSSYSQVITENWEWMKQQVISKEDSDPFWHQLGNLLWQLKGLDDAYFGKSPMTSSETMNLSLVSIDPFGPYMSNLVGDGTMVVESLLDGHTSSKGVSCSVLIKLLSNNKDLLVGHDTWVGYNMMLRILKKYDFSFHQTSLSDSPLVAATTISMSSYPGVVSSLDDFYQTSAKLVVTETTIPLGNERLYQTSLAAVKGGGVFSQLRAQISNRLANSGQDWINYFARANSGTYNNQWMVVDYKLFVPGQPIPSKNIFFILEQLPGKFQYQDMSQTLKSQGYWASYNIPYFPEIYHLNFEHTVAPSLHYYSWNKTCRALIFARDEGTVTDMHSMMKVMRSNNFKHDNLSICTECYPKVNTGTCAVAARMDLNPNTESLISLMKPLCDGATDMKVTNSTLMNKQEMVALNGPAHDQLPEFRWSNSSICSHSGHRLHPDSFNFRPVLTSFMGNESPPIIIG